MLVSILLRDYLALYQLVIIGVVIALSAIILLSFVTQEPVNNIEITLLLPVFLRMLFIWFGVLVV